MRATNIVPVADRKETTLTDMKAKVLAFLDTSQKLVEKRAAIKQTGVIRRKESLFAAEDKRPLVYHISEDLDVMQLKNLSKAYGVTINDLFHGACIAAASKLDVPDELKPS